MPSNYCRDLRGKDKRICLQKHRQLKEMLKNSEEEMHRMLDVAYKSGALDEEFKEDNYLLSKAVITIWGRKGSYAPLNPRHKREVNNLEHFI